MIDPTIMVDSELDEKIRLAQIEADRIAADLDAAKVASRGGTPVDPRWYARADRARRRKRWLVTQLTQEKARRRREREGAGSAEAFVAAAKRILTTADFQYIEKSARETTTNHGRGEPAAQETRG